MEGNNKPAISSSKGWWIVIIVFIISAGIKIKLSLNSRSANQNNSVSNTAVTMDTSRVAMQGVSSSAQVAQPPRADTFHSVTINGKSDSSASTENKTNLPDNPTNEKIESDLVGQRMPHWIFDHLSEFQDMQIISSELSNNYLNITINFKLKDERVNRLFDSKVLVRYFSYENAWQFKDVSEIYYNEITNNATNQNGASAVNPNQSNQNNLNNGNNVPTTMTFRDMFSDNSHLWAIQSTSDCSFLIKDNQYQMECYSDKLFYSLNSTKNTALGSNYSINVILSHISGVANYGYGMVFAFKNSTNYYMFELSSQGYYKVLRNVDGNWVYVINWTVCNFLNTGDNVSNTIAIRKMGTACAFYINHRLVNSINNFDDTDAPYNGFVIENRQKIAIEAIRIFQ